MEGAWCASPTPGSIAHLVQGVLGPSTDLGVQMLSEEDRKIISSHWEDVTLVSNT